MDEELSTIQDNHNPYAKKLLPGHLAASTVEHLPREISRITHFLMFYGVNVTADPEDHPGRPGKSCFNNYYQYGSQPSKPSSPNKI